jgi:hypothetical protein
VNCQLLYLQGSIDPANQEFYLDLPPVAFYHSRLLSRLPTLKGESLVMAQSNMLKVAGAFAIIMLLLMNTSALPLTASKTRRVRFGPGRTTAVLNGAIVKDSDDVYLVRARKGQTMIVHITSKQDNAIFDITEPPPGSGTPFTRENKDWTDKLEKTGDYYIHVYGLYGAATTYTLEVTVR